MEREIYVPGNLPPNFIFVVPTAPTELPWIFFVGCLMYLIHLLFIYNGITLYVIKDTRWGVLPRTFSVYLLC